MIVEIDNSLLIKAKRMRAAYLKALFGMLIGHGPARPAHA